MILRTVLCVVILASAAAPASAAIVQYSDRNTWINASSGLTTIDFNSSTGAYNDGSGLTIGSVNFVGYGNQFANFTLSVLADEPFIGNPYLQGPFWTTGGFARIQVSLPANVRSAGVDIAYQNLGLDTFQVELSTGEIVTTVSTLGGYGQMAFFGVTSDNPFNSITFFVQNNAGFNKGILDNFAYGDVAQQQPPTGTPEAASLILSGAGLLLLYVGRHRLVSPEAAAR